MMQRNMEVADEIEKLAALRKAEIINEKGYNHAKAALLNGRNIRISDEIGKLHKLNSDGILSDSELKRTKNALLFKKEEKIRRNYRINYSTLYFVIAATAISAIYLHMKHVEEFARGFVFAKTINTKWKIDFVTVPLLSAFEPQYDVIVALENDDKSIQTVEATVSGFCWRSCVIGFSKPLSSYGVY